MLESSSLGYFAEQISELHQKMDYYFNSIHLPCNFLPVNQYREICFGKRDLFGSGA